MPTDSEGNFSLPPGTLVQVDDYITPSQHNPAMTDIAAGLTGRLARNGAGGMLANLNMNGRKIINAGPATEPTDLMTLGQSLLIAGIPIGGMIEFAGEFPPTGWVFADGRSFAVSAEPALFAVLGYRWGGAGATFAIPDTRGRVTAGLDVSVGGSFAGRLTTPDSRVLGASGGAENVTLTDAQMPRHGHGASSTSLPPHDHLTVNNGARTDNTVSGNDVVSAEKTSGGDSGYRLVRSTSTTPNAGKTTTAAGFTPTITVEPNGGGQHHTNVQPVLVVPKIIKIRN